MSVSFKRRPVSVARHVGLPRQTHRRSDRIDSTESGYRGLDSLPAGPARLVHFDKCGQPEPGVRQTRYIRAMATLGPWSTAVNFSIDLAGTPDTRPGTWGNAGFTQNITTFSPPAGHRVRVLRVYGNFIGFPKSGVLRAGTSCEVGWGLKTTAPDGSVHASTGYDNSFVWLQDVVMTASPSCSIMFDFDVRVGGLLEADHHLISQTFVALNTTGLTIHMEPTFTMIYQFEPTAG